MKPSDKDFICLDTTNMINEGITSINKEQVITQKEGVLNSSKKLEILKIKKQIVMKMKNSRDDINSRLGIIRERTGKLENITKETHQRTKHFKGQRSLTILI